jgi:hypothetical protein
MFFDFPLSSKQTLATESPCIDLPTFWQSHRMIASCMDLNSFHLILHYFAMLVFVEVCPLRHLKHSLSLRPIQAELAVFALSKAIYMARGCYGEGVKGSARHISYFVILQVLHKLGFPLIVIKSMPKSPKLSTTPSVEAKPVCYASRMTLSCRYEARFSPRDSLNHLWRQYIILVSMTQPSTITLTPWKDKSQLEETQWVVFPTLDWSNLNCFLWNCK